MNVKVYYCELFMAISKWKVTWNYETVLQFSTNNISFSIWIYLPCLLGFCLTRLFSDLTFPQECYTAGQNTEISITEFLTQTQIFQPLYLCSLRS